MALKYLGVCCHQRNQHNSDLKIQNGLLLSGICLWFCLYLRLFDCVFVCLFVCVLFSTCRESVGIPVEVVVMSPRITRKRIPMAKVLFREDANYEL